MPIFFPLIGIFLAFLTLYESFNWLGDASVPKIYWSRPLVMLAYTFFWVVACMGKKWGGIAFVVLSVGNIALHLFAPEWPVKKAIGDILFVPLPANLLFSFLLLFYIGRLR